MNFGLLDGFCSAAPDGTLDAALCLAAEWEMPLLLLLTVLAALGIWRWARGRDSDRGSRFILPITTSARMPRDLGMTAEKLARETDRQREEMRRALSPLDFGAPRPAGGARALSEDNGRGAASPPPPPPAGSGDDEGPEGTLQLLPGRLEVVRGPRKGEEIRFVRMPGQASEVTLGRVEGPSHRHVQLDSPTVSRQHARLTFKNGEWRLRNESTTNPTVHNGHALGSDVEEVALSDGDEIEVGEVLLTFRQEAPVDRLPARSSWYMDRGRRSVNQDAVVIRTLPGGRELAAVCDGMGSHAEGGVASHLAIESLVQSLSEGMALDAAVVEANRAVLVTANRSPDRLGMGTTLVALLRDGDRYVIANVGDSRAYRISGGQITQVTNDHSFVAEAIAGGRMSAEEAAQSPWKNAVTRSLGTEAEIDVDLFGPFEVTEPAIVLLCTDGVHGVVPADDVLALVRDAADIRDVARSLSERALVAGGEDNVAVAAIRFGSDAAALGR